MAETGLQLVEIDWRAPAEDFDGMVMVLLGTAWDYQDHPADFLAKLEALAERGIAIHNPPAIVRWNLDKRYLRELADAGVPTIPTDWDTAIRVFEESTVVPRIFAPTLIRNLILTKKQELHYMAELSGPEQVEIYLDTV